MIKFTGGSKFIKFFIYYYFFLQNSVTFKFIKLAKS